MSINWKCLTFFILISVLTNFASSENDFQTAVDNFMNAFEETYSREHSSATTDESTSSEYEVLLSQQEPHKEIEQEQQIMEEQPLVENKKEPEQTVQEEETVTEEKPLLEDKKDPEQPVLEEEAVTERLFKPGSELRHELTDEVRELAQRSVAAISSSLRLVRVTEALSMVTDRVQRSLALVVAPKDCEGESCSVSCRVELVSKDGLDLVSWHNCLDSAVVNEVTRDKRGAIGGFKQVDDEEAKELGELAVQTLDFIDADDKKRVVTKILRAQKQLVYGIMYHLTVEVGLTDCKESENTSDCENRIVDYNICKILMQRLFSGENNDKPQVIKSECTPVSQTEALDIQKKRVKKEITENGNEDNFIGDKDLPVTKTKPYRRKLGGQVLQDPNSEKIKEISEFVLSELDKSSNSLNKQQIVRIVDARSQIVAGVKYFLKLELVESNCRKGSAQLVCPSSSEKGLKSCEVVVWEKPWLKIKTITRVSCSPVESRTKRQVLGGKQIADVKDKKVMEMADFAVSQLSANSDSLNLHKLVELKEAQTQVVAGTNYYLKLQLVETSCKKGSVAGPDCLPQPDKAVKECDVVVWDQPWTKKREMTKSNCSDVKKLTKRQVLGGKQIADVKDKKVMEMADFAVSQLSANSDSLNLHKLVELKEAQTQVVAGTNYYLKLQLVETSCKKGSVAGPDCLPQPDKAVKECDVVVWDQPWTKKREMTKSNCSDVKKLTKRGIPGGLKEADVNDPKVQEMAKFAVSQLDASSNSLNSQKLLVVKEAKTQVVAGTNYYLKLQLVETNCRKGSEIGSQCTAIPDKAVQECDVVVYDRPWDKHREMTSANCSSPNKLTKREVLVGGHVPQEKNSPDIQEVARFAVEDLNKKSNALFKKTLVDVISAHTQVVSGVNYHLQLRVAESDCSQNTDSSAKCSPKPNVEHQVCNFTVWDQSWLNKRQVTKTECSNFSEDKKTVAKREALVGGPLDKEEMSEEIQEVAQFAVEELNKRSNAIYKQTLLEVVTAKSQVVAGLKYHLTLRMAESDCRKSDTINDLGSCSVKDATSFQECEVTVWSRPWLKSRELTKSICKQPLAKVIGGPQTVDPSSPEVAEAVKFILKTIDGSSNSIYKHALVRVVDAKVQTVSGKKYFLSLEVGESECTKGHKEENCTLKTENSLRDRCNAVVWDRPWLSKMEVLEVNCRGRDKRSMSGKPNGNELRMFEEFKAEYNRQYENEAEHNKRFRIFKANLKKIKLLQDTEQGTAVYGPNMFADLTAKEFRKKYLGLKPGTPPKPSSHHMVPAKIPYNELPTDFDWRDHNVVTPVKNQGQCGSCWAFSVTGNIEGQWALKHGELISLSEQELVDCDKSDNGCNGGYMTMAYEAIEELGGLETEDEYPYDAEDEKCKFNKSEVRATVSSSVNITTNETEIAQWLYANGPISIGINANAMQFYMGGVSHPLKFLCSKSQLDHGVLLVGFGVHRTSIRHKLLPYWLVKNSWGPRWGEKGYYRVYRGDSTCGVNQMCSSAIVD